MTGSANLAGLLDAPARRLTDAPAVLLGDEVARSWAELAGAVARRTGALRTRLGLRPDGVRLVVSGEAEERSMPTTDAIEPVSRAPGDDAWIFYTSGTTGRSKGARLSHASVLAMAATYYADVAPVGADDSLVHAATLSHASGLFALPFLARGAAQVLTVSSGFDPAELVAFIEAGRRSTFFVPPVLLRRLCAAPQLTESAVDRLGTVLSGAAPLRPRDLRAGVLALGPRVWNGYGQGESPLTSTAMSTAEVASALDDEERLLSVGTPRLATRVRVVDPDGYPLSAGEIGGVVVDGPTVMSGYIDRPQETADTLRGGWLHTGDIGLMDADGYLTLVDRVKDVVITGGYNVYPREVEDVLAGHHTQSPTWRWWACPTRSGARRCSRSSCPRMRHARHRGAGRPLPGAHRSAQAAPGIRGGRRAPAKPRGQGAQECAARSGDEEFTMTRIELLDSTIRDGQQSLWGMRMQAGMALPVAHLLDRTGFRTIDFAGSSMFEVLVKYCREDPWQGLDLLRDAIRRTPMRGGMRANACVSFGVTPDALMDTWMRRLNEHGIRSFWIYDCLFGWRKMARLARIAHEYGSEVAGTVFFSLSPVHTDAYFAERTAEMAAVDEIDTILLYDTAGVLDTDRMRTLIPAVQAAAASKPVEFHSNNLMGTSGLA